RTAPIRCAGIGIWVTTTVAVAIAVTIRIAAAVVIRRRDRGAQRETSHYSARPPPTARAPAPTTAPSPATAPSPPHIDNVARHGGLHGNRIRRYRRRLELRCYTHRERAGDA